MTARRQPHPCILLMAIALVVASVPRAGTGGIQVDLVPTPLEGTACCPHDQSCASEPAPDTIPASNDCCPIGCDDCFLPCCAGPVSLPGVSAPPIGPELGWPSPMPRYHVTFCSIDPPTIYRPPRS